MVGQGRYTRFIQGYTILKTMILRIAKLITTAQTREAIGK